MNLEIEAYEGELRELRKLVSQPKYEFECPRCGHCCQQREWVDLTDEEIYIMRRHFNDFTHDAIRYVEAKLKEKNT
jgi:hypothetical protein